MSDLWTKGRTVPRRRRAQLNWLLTVLPAFPLVLLVLRLWWLARQDVPTMLLLVQHISPLGMISALLITLIWSVPAIILVLRMLGSILLVSTPEDAGRSLLAVTALRMPDWVVMIAAMLAALTWQLLLLPLLGMLIVAILGLTAAQRFRAHKRLMAWVTVGVPVLVGGGILVFVWPGVVEAFRAGEMTTGLLLLLPPLLGPLLTGGVPARFARLVTHWPAVGAALLAPLAIGVVFLRAPVLPNSAVEVGPANGPIAEVVRGQLIVVDDTATTVLEDGGLVRFVPNGEVRSKTLCPEPAPAPDSTIKIHGWPVGDSALSWTAPTRSVTEVDPRCLGRPLDPS